MPPGAAAADPGPPAEPPCGTCCRAAAKRLGAAAWAPNSSGGRAGPAWGCTGAAAGAHLDGRYLSTSGRRGMRGTLRLRAALRRLHMRGCPGLQTRWRPGGELVLSVILGIVPPAPPSARAPATSAGLQGPARAGGGAAPPGAAASPQRRRPPHASGVRPGRAQFFQPRPLLALTAVAGGHRAA